MLAFMLEETAAEGAAEQPGEPVFTLAHPLRSRPFRRLAHDEPCTLAAAST